MNIVIIGTAYPYRGGLAAFNERLAQQFVSEGHNVEIYTFTLQYPNFLFPGKTQYSTEPDNSGLKIYRKINSCNPFNWIKVGKELKKKKPDIVIFAYWMSFMAPCMGYIAKIIKNSSKRIALVHNMIPHEKTILDKILPPFFVNKIDAFVTLSQSVINDINRLDKNNRPKTWNPHPIYDHYGKLIEKAEAKALLNLESQVKYVLFFGIIRNYKGLDLLIAAFEDKRLLDLNVKLLVAGEFYGNGEKKYLAQIKSAKLENRIVLHTEFIPDSKVNSYFRACDIVAQPYKSATQSGVTQIAFHFEKPMLVTNVGGLAEIVPNGKIGYVVEPNSTAIANGLVDYFGNNREAEYAHNMIAEKEKYAWNKLTNKILNILNKIQ